MRRSCPNQYGAYDGGVLADLTMHHVWNGVCACLVCCSLYASVTPTGSCCTLACRAAAANMQTLRQSVAMLNSLVQMKIQKLAADEVRLAQCVS